MMYDLIVVLERSNDQHIERKQGEQKQYGQYDTAHGHPPLVEFIRRFDELVEQQRYGNEDDKHHNPDRGSVSKLVVLESLLV